MARKRKLRGVEKARKLVRGYQAGGHVENNFINRFARIASAPLEAIGIAGPNVEKMLSSGELPIASALQRLGLDPATAQSLAETSESILPVAGMAKSTRAIVQRKGK